ncbi:MAG: transketolase [Pseudomonadota bacterium]
MDIAAMKASDPRRFEMANALRILALDGVKAANSGHSGMPMGMADVATVLFDKFLRFDASAPDWPDRDRFVLSAGHGSMLLYGLLYLTGTTGMTLEQVKNFRQLGAATAGHPEAGHAPGIETTTGPLGQGLATAVGMAIAEEHLRARFGKKICDHKTWVIAGDGCLMEGVSHEAIGLAGMQQLSNLIVLWDDNGITIDGPVSMSDRTDQKARFAAAGWDVFECDGHNTAEIEAVLAKAAASKAPAMVACRTRIGIGSSAEGTAKAHGALTDDQLIADARKTFGWDHGPFDIPATVKKAWEAVGSAGEAARTEWESRLAALSESKQKEFARVTAGEVPTRLTARLRAHKKTLSETAPSMATRSASQKALEVINTVLPETIGGSADLTGSNNTKTADLGVFAPGDRKGRHIHYGIREHGMAAAMNGMALHGGVVPYGGTFMCFTDYARGAMRLSSLMNQRVVYVMTHDSIGLGEDGPTHQPVEHLAMLRATPNLKVIRPADAVETAEAWEMALSSEGPSVLALTRQNLPTVRTKHVSKNQVAMGGYILAEAEGRRRAILIATGSEVEIAMAARDKLQADGIGTRVVSMPCFELFATQDEKYRKRVLPAGPVRVGVEAAVRLGWDSILMGERGSEKKAAFVGMSGFGASAPYKQLYAHFGITAETVAATARNLL